MAVARDIVQKYVESALKSEVLEDSFMTLVAAKQSDQSECPGVKSFLMTISKTSEPDTVIKHYVKLMAQVKSPIKFDRLFQTLRLVIQQHPNLSKAVCEALLTIENLDYRNTNYWMRSFDYITEILPTIDYKGVRDVLKMVLEIIYIMPDKFDTAIIPQLDILYSTFSIILDREACLLPAYLGLDELQKKISQGNAPVWKFAELFYQFIETFRPTAQIFSIINRTELLPIVGYSNPMTNSSWRLDPISAKFQLKGLLPYRDKLKEPQARQVKYLLEQPYSKETLTSTLGLNPKPQQTRVSCAELIEQMANSIIDMMEKTPANIESYTNYQAEFNEHIFQWMHLSNNILFYINSTNSFNVLVDSLCQKLITRHLRKGREHLMFAMLQYITGAPKSSVNDFIATSKLIEILYTGRTSIPIPDEEFQLSTHTLSAASIWFQIVRRSELDGTKVTRSLPQCLQSHYDYITSVEPSPSPISSLTYRDAVFVNSNNTTRFGQAITHAADLLTKIDPTNNSGPLMISPLPVHLLDLLTTHSKVALIHSIVSKIILLAQNQNKSGMQTGNLLTPALIETYGRLLVYPDCEFIGIKVLLGQLINGQTAVWRTQAWHIYHALLEMFNYRLNHIPLQYKFQMLFHLHGISNAVYNINSMQLAMTTEATELKLLLGLSNHDVLNLSSHRHSNDKQAKVIFNGDSEELNKVLVLVLARSTQLTSNEHYISSIMEEILTDIIKVTPLVWSSSTMNFFPSYIKEFFIRNSAAKETDRAQLRSAVDEEYRKWKAISNDNNVVAHFSQPNAPPLFICILWKMLVENGGMSPVVYRILDNIKLRAISVHLRTFVDYLVYEFANSGAKDMFIYADALNDLIWKFHVVSIDRLLLCMCLRSYDDSKTRVCFFIMQLLLLKRPDFKDLVHKFCKVQEPEHWKAKSNSYNANMEFLRHYPEKYYHDLLAENNIPSNGQTLPSFFSNVCLRFIPVLDILIHRGLELEVTAQPNQNSINIKTIIDEFRGLYKFHDKPLTYLYETLHYYDTQIPQYLKKKLTANIVLTLGEMKPPNWCLTDSLLQYLQKPNSQPGPEEWVPNQDYYVKLIGRLVDCLQGKNTFYYTDWRFNEFPNVKSHAVHSIAIELMSCPQEPNIVGNAILDIILTTYVNQDRETVSQWMNAIGLVMSSLPSSYYKVLNNKILEYMQSPLLTNLSYTRDILHLMNYCDNFEWMYESQISYLVALTHSIWHHSTNGQIFGLPSFWRQEIKEAVETESQFLFACCLIGPFLQRMERSRIMMDIVVDLYEMLGKVDKKCEIVHLDTICDFFYHIKYMFTGDAVKKDIERCIRNFKPRLQYCLRFITPLNVANSQ